MIFGGSFLSLPEGISNHIMNPFFEEDKKVTKCVTLTLTHKCFATCLPPVWSGKLQVFSYTPPPFHWSERWTFYLSLPGVLERFQSFGSMSGGANEAVSAPLHFLHEEGSGVHLDTEFLFVSPSPPLDKTGERYNPFDLQTPHTVRWRTSAPQTWQKEIKVQNQKNLWVLPNAAYRTMGVVVKVCI